MSKFISKKSVNCEKNIKTVTACALTIRFVATNVDICINVRRNEAKSRTRAQSINETHATRTHTSQMHTKKRQIW